MSGFDLEEILRKQLAIDSEFIESGKQLMPYILGHNKEKDENYLVMTSFEDSNSKEMLCRLMPVYFFVTGVTSYVYVSEAWMRMIVPEDPENFDVSKAIPPSQVDDRQECVIGVGVSYDKKVSLMCKIKRKKGVITVSKPESMSVEVEGRFTNLLPPKDTPPMKEELMLKMKERFESMFCQQVETERD